MGGRAASPTLPPSKPASRAPRVSVRLEANDPVPLLRSPSMRLLQAFSAALLAGLATSATLVAAPQTCPTCVPLSDLGTGTYLGFQGGLYSGGQNEVPAAYRPVVRRLLGGVVPRDASGAPDPDGLVGMISIGMSNASQEFAAFIRRADRDEQRDARIVIVDGADNAQTADRIVDPNVPFWSNLDGHIARAGLTGDQVQFLWLKQAQAVIPDTSFPAHAQSLQSDLASIVRHLKTRFPNLSAVFLSSRIYGGYSAGPLSSEPLTYETGFAVKWLIEQQQSGDPALNPDPLLGPVEAPLLLWGPYIWANGSTPRSDGLVWDPADLSSDGLHPSPSGEAKVVDMIEDHFKSDEFARVVYDARDGAALESIEAIHDAHVDDTQPNAASGLDTFLRMAGSVFRSFIRFPSPQGAGDIAFAKFGLYTAAGAAPFTVHELADTGWDEATITAANAPLVTSPAFNDFTCFCRQRAIAFEATELARHAHAGGIGVALIPEPAAPNYLLMGREGGQAAVLLVTRDLACGGVEPYCSGAPNSAGEGATLEAFGSVSVAANDLVLHAADLPPSTFGLFAYSRGAFEMPFGDGLLCVAPPLFRLDLVQANGAGDLDFPFDLTALPASAGAGQVLAGDRIYFQLWYRDVLGPLGSGYNVSGGLAVRFCP